jgi:hypothetical protein
MTIISMPNSISQFVLIEQWLQIDQVHPVLNCKQDFIKTSLCTMTEGNDTTVVLFFAAHRAFSCIPYGLRWAHNETNEASRRNKSTPYFFSHPRGVPPPLSFALLQIPADPIKLNRVE